MTDEVRGTTEVWVPDTLDMLGHLLIRAHNGDGLDPFFVKGHPNMARRDGRHILSCFYYSVMLTPKLAVVYDNDGAGGMCTMHPEEIAAVWRMPRLLEALGVSYDDLQAGRMSLEGVSLPEPCWRPSPDPDKACTEDADAPAMPILR